MFAHSLLKLISGLIIKVSVSYTHLFISDVTSEINETAETEGITEINTATETEAVTENRDGSEESEALDVYKRQVQQFIILKKRWE